MTKKTLLAIIGAAAGLAAVAGVSAAVIFRSPEIRAAKGISYLVEDLVRKEHPIFESDETVAVTQLFSSGSIKQDFQMNISGIEGLDMTLGLDGSALYSNADRKAQGNFKFSVANYDIVNMKMTVDDTNMYIAIPELYGGNITFNTVNIGSQWNQSLFGSKNKPVKEDFSLELFRDGEGSKFSFKDFYKDNKLDFIEAIKDITVEKTDASVEAERNGTQSEAKGYRVTLAKDSINNLIEIYNNSYMDNRLSMLSADLNMIIFMDKKDHVVQIETQEPLQLEGNNGGIHFAAGFLGAENAWDSVKGSITYEDTEEQKVLFEYESKQETDIYSDRLQFKLTENGADLAAINFGGEYGALDSTFDISADIDYKDENYSLELRGDWEQAEESITLQIDDLIVNKDGKKLAKATGYISMEALAEEITVPQGKTYPVLEFSYSDFYSFIKENSIKSRTITDFLN